MTYDTIVAENVMPKFGKYNTAHIYFFRDNPQLWWKFKPPSIDDEIEIERYLKAEVSGRGFSVTAYNLSMTVAYMELSATFAGTNVPHKSVEGISIFSTVSSRSLIETSLSYADPFFVIELWKEVCNVRPGWGLVNARYKIEIA